MGQRIGSPMRAWWCEARDGERVEAIAKELQCSPRRCDVDGIASMRRGLRDWAIDPDPDALVGSGRGSGARSLRSSVPRRLGGTRRKQMRRWEPEMRTAQQSASLDALAQAAKAAGIGVKRSQIRTILLQEGVGFRRTHSWGSSDAEDARPKRTAVVTHYTKPPSGSTTICTDELGPVVPRTFPAPPGWSPTGHRIKAPLDYSRGPEKTWVDGARRVRDGKELTRCTASRNSSGYIALREARRGG
jgi:hypothetical protein